MDAEQVANVGFVYIDTRGTHTHAHKVARRYSGEDTNQWYITIIIIIRVLYNGKYLSIYFFN